MLAVLVGLELGKLLGLVGLVAGKRGRQGHLGLGVLDASLLLLVVSNHLRYPALVHLFEGGMATLLPLRGWLRFIFLKSQLLHGLGSASVHCGSVA